MPGTLRSSAYLPRPVTLARPSAIGRGLPMMLKPLLEGESDISAGGLGCRVAMRASRAALFERVLHGFVDLHVAGAAAKIAGERFANFVERGIRITIEQGFRGNHEARRAETALRAAHFGEALLDRIELARTAESFYGGDFALLIAGGERDTGKRWNTVNQHGAATATGVVAAALGAG